MKVKIKSGAKSAVFTVDPQCSVLQLASFFPGTALEGLSVTSYRFGFPARSVQAQSDETLQEAGIVANEQLTAECGCSAQPKSQDEPFKVKTSNKICNVHIPTLAEYLVLRNVPDDNSCLFNAILYALTGNIKWPEVNLRHVVAETVRHDHQTYDEVVLGRTNAKYCEWIEKPDSWGGAIELGILAKFLQVRINCFDVELGNMMVFQDESAAPSKFIVLVYSGIHYDCLATNRDLTESRTDDTGHWCEHETAIVEASSALVKLLQSRNYTTNTTTFRVRCLECYEICVGEMGANTHANNTGHYRFGEVS